MKVYVANSSEQKVGGGWSFISNFKKGMGDSITGYNEADIFFIAGSTMVQRDEVKKAKEAGKKIVLRVDNVVRHSRNRGTGMPRMKDYADWADLVIYQSAWAQDYLKHFTGKKGTVILNGVDRSIFNDGNRSNNMSNTYVYTRFNRDETKNWHMAWYEYIRISRMNPGKSLLHIVGNFSPDLQEYNFDFFNNESYRFWGVQPPEVMADIYRQSDFFLYPYYNDACSNSLIEALCCGCFVMNIEDMVNTGGASEILESQKAYGMEYLGLERMCKEYTEAMGAL